VKLLALFSRLFLAVAVAGLLIAPIAASQAEAVASAMSQGSMNEGPSMSMPDGMPCCPEQSPLAPDHQKSCPLVVACMMGAATIAPAAAASVLILTKGQVIALRNDLERKVLASAPPLRPPRA
jgi:hypothetical protein